MNVMVTSQALRFGGPLTSGLFVLTCDGGVETEFAQPFPTKGAGIAVFPARYQDVYTAADPSKSLCIGATAVWRQERHSFVFSRYQLDFLHNRLTLAPGPQTRHLGHCTELWETAGEYGRRR